MDRTRFPKVPKNTVSRRCRGIVVEEEIVLQEIKNPFNTTHIFLLPQEEMASSCRNLDEVMNCNDFSNL